MTSSNRQEQEPLTPNPFQEQESLAPNPFQEQEPLTLDPFQEPQQSDPGNQSQGEAPDPEQGQGGMNLIRTYLELRRQHQETDRTLKTLASKMADIEEDIINYLENQDLDRVVMRGLSVSIARDISTSVQPDLEGSMDAFHQDMRQAGLDHMIKESIHPQTLRAWIREQNRQEKDIPQNVARHLNIKDTAKISVKKA